MKNIFSYSGGGDPIQVHVTFGWELIMDLYECNPAIISSEHKIKAYAQKLCNILQMKAYGEPLTPYFGESQAHTKGYSLLQFIETSSITGHFSESTRAAYINIFSCKPYDIDQAETFTRDFFNAQRINTRYFVRE